MEGVIEVTVGLAEQARTYEEALEALRTMKPDVRSILGLDQKVACIEKALATTHRALELSKTFKQIKHDSTAVRRIRKGNGITTPIEVEVPLIFRSELPARATKTMSLRGFRGQNASGTFKISADVPTPPIEALKAMGENKAKFDRMEVWWVPKKIHVTEQKPDPIIVGVVESPMAGLEPFFFDIYRWVDETVEAGYWAREAY